MAEQVKQISVDTARAYLDKTRLERRILLDVRQEFEYQEGHLPGAKWIPLPDLGERYSELDPALPVLVYCRSGARSLSAANLLAGKGFEHVMSMDGGINAWNGAQAVGPRALGFSTIPDKLSPAELLERAWGMELALEHFYAGLARKADDAALAALYTRLAGFEVVHRRVLIELWSRLGNTDVAGFEARAKELSEPGVLEGGLSARDFLGLTGEPEDSAEALELAMSIEAQALDLYTRRAALAKDADLRRALETLAAEENAHLKVLGAFVDGRGRM
jgi:rhodanese-related sulfurtransferase/rubrerythrin